MELKRIERGSALELVTVEELAAYIGVPSSVRSAELMQSIEVAVRHFEDRDNIALRSLTISLFTLSDGAGKVRLYYHPVVELLSVERPTMGAVTDFTILPSYIQLRLADTEVVVKYKSEAIETASDYKLAIMGWASLVFNGETEANEYSKVEKWV